MSIVALLEPLPEPLLAALSRHLPSGAVLKVVSSTTDAEAQCLAAEAAVLLVWNGPLASATFAAATNARLAQVCERRPRGVDFFTARRRGVPVCGPGPAGAQVAAEHALLLGLAALRGLPAALHDPAPLAAAVGRALHGLSVGLYGFDPVGCALANLLLTLGATVTYWDEAQPEQKVPASLRRARFGYEPLAAADLVSLHLSPRPDRRGAIGRETLRMFRRDAVLVNVSSPELIDERSLYQALANRRLAAAALDSLTDVNPPLDHPLRTLPNVLLTPRLAYATEAAVEDLAAAAMANAQRALDGKELVDRWA